MAISADGRPPFRADHIGSLLRPPQLRQAFRQHSEGKLDDAAFRAVQDEAIREVLRLQEECGLQVVTDGEFRRISYWEKFVRLTRGLVVKDAMFRFHDAHGHESAFTAPYAVAKVGRSEPITLDEYRFASALTRATQKITMPAPSTMHFYRFTQWAEPGVYQDSREFFADLGEVYQAEIADLARAGCRYVQLDEVALAVLCDPAAREQVKAAGGDPEELVDLYVDAINEAVKGLPAGIVVGIHMCRGNYKGMYLSEGGYDSVAEKLFGRANVNHFLLEFDTPRAGSFTPLRFLPKTKGVVLGMVSSKVPQLESIDSLKRRADEAAKYVDPARCAVSPQCGFASTIGGNPVTESDERAKLRLCVEAARAIWRD
ncbi:MAG TPA: 5-methyltetrahydropteroyltriglutamate--homocysteine S-methyltransferase [Burkholderiales bacterium]|jgi:5-methyltetrahydropteroyltriglutamate--homocysteine methyltransferase|nr:5-methyltetrahydropteroyltriglutamate--homocysteine S-methyltransferase [Burkholderiales bacterium]